LEVLLPNIGGVPGIVRWGSYLGIAFEQPVDIQVPTTGVRASRRVAGADRSADAVIGQAGSVSVL